MRLAFLIILSLQLQAQIILNRSNYFTGGGGEPQELVDTSSVTYPIYNIVFDTGSIDTAATGSDNWAVTWLANNDQWVTWGDGGGFNGADGTCRTNLGFGIISGDYGSHTLSNLVNGCSPTFPEAQFESGFGFCYGVQEIDGVMYFWRNGDNDAPFGSPNFRQELWKSTNGGDTWTDTGVGWDKPNDFGDAFPTMLTCGFVQYDKGTVVGRGDDYIYSTFSKIDSVPGDYTTSQIFLMRVHRDSMETKASYSFLASSTPTWTYTIASAVPIFDGSGIFDLINDVSMLFHPLFKRYIFTFYNDRFTPANTELVIYNSNLMWNNEWKTSYRADPFTAGLNFGSKAVFANFSQKWMNDTSGVMIYVSHADNFATIECEFDSNEVTGFVITDNFNRANNTNLDGNGTLNGEVYPLNYTETNSDASISSNQVIGVDDNVAVRLEKVIGKENIYTKLTVNAVESTRFVSLMSRWSGVTGNINTTGHYAYFGGYDDGIGTEILKWVDGTPTGIDADAYTPSLPEVFELRITPDGSGGINNSLLMGGAERSLGNDATAIAENFFNGFRLRGTTTQIDNYEIGYIGEYPYPYVASSQISKTTADGVNWVATKPAGVKEGDLLVAFIAKDDDDDFSVIPDGWTLVRTQVGGTATRFSCYYKIATYLEPKTYTWTGDSEEYVGTILRIRNFNPAHPIDTSGVGTGTTNAPIAPSVTTTENNCLIIYAFGADDDDTPYTMPGTLAISWSDISATGTAGCGTAGGETLKPTAGATGTRTFGMNASEEWGAITIAIEPQ